MMRGVRGLPVLLQASAGAAARRQYGRCARSTRMAGSPVGDYAHGKARIDLSAAHSFSPLIGRLLSARSA